MSDQVFIQRRGKSQVSQVRETNPEKVKVVKINLEDLYGIGSLEVTSGTLLENLLKLYNINGYKIVAIANPDWNWFVLWDGNELRELIVEELRKNEIDESCSLRCLFREGLIEKVALGAITKYAKKHGYPIVVELYDGYEYSWAVLKGAD